MGLTKGQPSISGWKEYSNLRVAHWRQTSWWKHKSSRAKGCLRSDLVIIKTPKINAILCSLLYFK